MPGILMVITRHVTTIWWFWVPRLKPQSYDFNYGVDFNLQVCRAFDDVTTVIVVVIINVCVTAVLGLITLPW